MESCRSGEALCVFSFSDEDLASDVVSVELSGTALGSGLAKAGSGISKFDTVDSDRSLRCFFKPRSPLPRSLGRVTGLPAGVCSGVFVLEFHTPSTSQPLSIALIPNGTSSSRVVVWVISPRSAVSAVLRSEYLLILLLLRHRTPKEKTRTAP